MPFPVSRTWYIDWPDDLPASISPRSEGALMRGLAELLRANPRFIVEEAGGVVRVRSLVRRPRRMDDWLLNIGNRAEFTIGRAPHAALAPSIVLSVSWAPSLLVTAAVVAGLLVLQRMQGPSLPARDLAVVGAGMWAFLATAYYVKRMIDVKNWIRWRQADLAVITRRAVRPSDPVASAD